MLLDVNFYIDMLFELREIKGLKQHDQTHWEIKALVVNGKSPAMDVLERWGKCEESEFKKIMKAMKRVGTCRRVKEPKHVKKNTNPEHGDVYEMRAHQGHARLMFFYSEHENVEIAVCANGYWKGRGSQDNAFSACAELKKLYEKYINKKR